MCTKTPGDSFWVRCLAEKARTTPENSLCLGRCSYRLCGFTAPVRFKQSPMVSCGFLREHVCRAFGKMTLLTAKPLCWILVCFLQFARSPKMTRDFHEVAELLCVTGCLDCTHACNKVMVTTRKCCSCIFSDSFTSRDRFVNRFLAV